MEDAAKKLAEAVALLVDPTIDNQQRVIMNEYVEKFKTTPQSLQVSIQIIQWFVARQQPSFVISEQLVHFAFQCLEHHVKCSWNNLDEATKSHIKQFLESLIQPVNDSIKTWPRFVLAVVARVFVECMKREWPQRWPHLLSHLLSNGRHPLVLFIILRLGEDLGYSFEGASASLPPDRRRDLHAEFVQNLEAIIAYIGDAATSQEITLAVMALETMFGFTEWAPIHPDVVTFLTSLLTLMPSPQGPDQNTVMKVKTMACDCLIQTCNLNTSRKDFERQLMIDLLFKSEKLVQIAQQMNIMSNEIQDNEEFNFRRRFSLLCSLVGQHVVAHWTNKDKTKVTDDEFVKPWTQYFLLMTSILAHENSLISCESVAFFGACLRHANKGENLIRALFTLDGAMAQNLMQTLVRHLYKVSSLLISEEDALNLFTGFELSDEEDVESHLVKYRAELLDLIRNHTILHDEVCFTFLLSEYETHIFGNDFSGNRKEAEERVAHLAAAVMNKLPQPMKFAEKGSQLLKYLLETMPSMPSPPTSVSLSPRQIDEVSARLSSVSACVVFLPNETQPADSKFNTLVEMILNKVFSMVNYELPFDSVAYQEAKEIRRHACSFFVKFCTQRSLLLKNYFSRLYALISALRCLSFRLIFTGPSTDLQLLSQVELITLNEGLMLIANHLENSNDHREYIQYLLHLALPDPNMLPFLTLDQALISSNDASRLISFLGLDLPPEPSDIPSSSLPPIVEEKRRNRAAYLFSVSSLLSLMKRTEKTRREILISCDIISKINHFVMPTIIYLNNMWIPSNIERCHPELRACLFPSIPEAEKNTLLSELISIHPPSRRSKPGEESDQAKNRRIQNFIGSLHENLFSFLGTSCGVLGPTFYCDCLFAPINSDKIAGQIGVSSLLKEEELANLPLWKLRMILRYFYKPFIQNLSQLVNPDGTLFGHLQNRIIPAASFSTFLSHLYRRLHLKWQQETQAAQNDIESPSEVPQANNKAEQERKLEDELAHDQILRLLSREFVDLLLSFLEKIQIINQLTNESLAQSLFICGLDSIVWQDSTASHKSTILLTKLCEKLFSSQPSIPINDIIFMYQRVLNALSLFGEHEQNCGHLLTLALLLYEGSKMSSQAASLDEYLAQYVDQSVENAPGSSLNKWHSFRQTVNHGKTKEKQKKDNLKKLLEPIIGRNVGQFHIYQKSQVKSLFESRTSKPFGVSYKWKRGLGDNANLGGSKDENDTDHLASLSTLFS